MRKGSHDFKGESPVTLSHQNFKSVGYRFGGGPFSGRTFLICHVTFCDHAVKSHIMNLYVRAPLPKHCDKFDA